jgi:aminopeptidase N
MLHDSALDGVAAMQRVVGTVSHEAAHMYFGNLVTLKWWDECVFCLAFFHSSLLDRSSAS